MCDPYPAGVDTSATREIIKLLKDSGNHVQISTKSGEQSAVRDFDLLDENDWFGIITLAIRKEHCLPIKNQNLTPIRWSNASPR